MSDIYSIKDVARIFGLKESRLRYWAQVGFVNPSVRKNGRSFYTFRDLIQVRAAKDLLDAGLSIQKVRKNLDALRVLLPDAAYPASKLHISSDGETVVARDDDVLFEPLTGQVVMDFTIDALSTQVADILALPTSVSGFEVPDVRPTRPPISAPPSREAIVEDDPYEATPLYVDDEATEAYAPESAYRYFLQGCEAEDRGDLGSAEAAYRQSLALQPTLAAAHTNLGNLLYRRGDIKAAQAAYARALELEPNQPEARYNLGNVLEDMGETELAISELRRVCWTHPEFADAHYNLGLMLARVGGMSQAQEHLRRYIELDKSSEWAERARNFLTALA